MLDVYVYDEVQDVESNPQLIKYAQPLQRGGVPISLSLLISSQAQNSSFFFLVIFVLYSRKDFSIIYTFFLSHYHHTHSLTRLLLLCCFLKRIYFHNFRYQTLKQKRE